MPPRASRGRLADAALFTAGAVLGSVLLLTLASPFSSSSSPSSGVGSGEVERVGGGRAVYAAVEDDADAAAAAASAC